MSPTLNTHHEVKRLLFIERRDGLEAAKDFARRTYRNYRECLFQTGKNGRKFHHASLPQYRQGFIESCFAFRIYPRTV